MEMKNDVVFEAKTKKYHLRYRDSLTWAVKVNRKKETGSEKVLWNRLLRKKKLGFKFTRQKPIDRFIADFYCSELNLVIEIDGGSHSSKQGRDELRDRDVINDIGKVEKEIREFIGPLPCQRKGLGKGLGC